MTDLSSITQIYSGNTYMHQEGGTVCRLCEGGVVNSNNTQCVLCTEGEHSTGAQCEQCPAGISLLLLFLAIFL